MITEQAIFWRNQF